MTVHVTNFCLKIAQQNVNLTIELTVISRVHRSQTLLWYNQCKGGYDKFVTAGTISFNGVFTLERKTERMDGMKMGIDFCVYIVFK